MRNLRTTALIGVAILALAGCATGTGTAPPSVDVTGNWVGTWAFTGGGTGGGPVNMNLKQTGASVTGDLRASGGPINRSGPIAGVVSGDTFRITSPPEGSFSVQVKGDDMSGQVFGIAPASVSLKRQR